MIGGIFMAKGKMQRRVDSFKSKGAAYEVANRRPIGDWSNYSNAFRIDRPTNEEVQKLSKILR